MLSHCRAKKSDVAKGEKECFAVSLDVIDKLAAQIGATSSCGQSARKFRLQGIWPLVGTVFGTRIGSTKVITTIFALALLLLTADLWFLALTRAGPLTFRALTWLALAGLVLGATWNQVLLITPILFVVVSGAGTFAYYRLVDRPRLARQRKGYRGH